MFKSLRWVMALLGTIGVAAALFVAAQGYHFINKLDASATKVYVAKDVVADILPPPLYLIEMRLVLSMMLDGSVSPADGKKRFDELAADYADRVAYWTKNPPFGLEAKLLGAQHTAGQAFIDAARRKIVEPVMAGQLDVAKANLASVHALYLQHRAGVDDTVKDGNALAEAVMKEFSDTHTFSISAMLVTAVVAGVLVFVVYRVVLGSIQKPVRASTRAAKLIASGDLATHTPMDLGRSDSLGDLQAALQTMRTGLNETVSSVRGGQRVCPMRVARSHRAITTFPPAQRVRPARCSKQLLLWSSSRQWSIRTQTRPAKPTASHSRPQRLPSVAVTW